MRLRVFRRLYDDDALLVLAWLILLTTAVLWLVNRTLKLVYVGYKIVDGDVAPPAYFLQHLRSWNHILLAETYLNLCGLWCVKFSFLAFFRRLGYHVKGQKLMWWTVSLFTVAGLIVSVIMLLFPCGSHRSRRSKCIATSTEHIVTSPQQHATRSRLLRRSVPSYALKSDAILQLTS